MPWFIFCWVRVYFFEMLLIRLLVFKCIKWGYISTVRL
ncbi:hypothetical protein I3842_05G170400 [Carya illinoinensis]|uniref:Uncharacterized protein n=1 Tax=Carya illinoinensis TaxID=32201 RepID=A0A922F0D7_CARIL|nr:hypothetical protein I3842_05G170400 [Carya illinoinensis]